MKLAIFLTIAFAFHAIAESKAQKITLHKKNAPLREVMREIQRQQGYSFLFHGNHIADIRVDVKLAQVEFADAMRTILEQKGLDWVLEEGIVTITAKPSRPVTQTEPLQQRVVSGKVTDEQGNPIDGVTVTVKGTSVAVKTSTTGDYRIVVDEQGNMLVFSIVGFETMEQSIGELSTVNISMKVSISDLDEVVVVGYGTRTRKSITGSVATVKPEELTTTPVANLAQGLQGRVAGLDMRQNSGTPGGNISIRIRGTNSINGTSEPLYVIDGIQISASSAINAANPLSQINPSDVASVEVLKDASATAIYGARAANGVVLITTKRGTGGVTNVTYDGYIGQQSPTNKLDILNATQFAELENDTYSPNVIYEDPAILGEGTNYLDLVLRQGSIQNHQVSVVGGSENTQAALGLNYFNQEGVIKNSDYQRYALRLNVDQKINKSVKVGTSLYYTITGENKVRAGGTGVNVTSAREGILGRAVAAPPTLSPFRADGSPFPFADQMNGRYRETVNPMAELARKDFTTVNRFLVNGYLEVAIVEGLTYRASFNADLGSNLFESYSPRSIVDSVSLNNPNAINGSAGNTSSYNRSLLHESILSFRKDFANNHTISATAVYGTQTDQFQSNAHSASGFGNDYTENWSTGSARNFTVSSGRNKTLLDSYLGRVGYEFKDRYYLDLTGRVDGSSKFGANNKYGFFPAASVAWRITEESFMSAVHQVDDIKLRASYGVTGNAGAIGPYGSLATVMSGSYNYNFNNVMLFGTYPSGIANADLKWERATQLDVGLDISLFGNRLNGVLDYYYKRTDDLLFTKMLPMSSGYAAINGNYGSIENKGLEVAINAKLLTGAFSWDIAGNITFNQNKVLALDGVQDEIAQSSYSVLKVGYPLGTYKVYLIDGIYQTDEAFLPGSDARTGGIKLKDVSGDGEISNEDMVLYGNAQPKYYFGLTTNLRYKNFDLSGFLQGIQGSSLFNAFRFTFETPSGQVNLLAGMADRWTPTNPSNEYVRAAQGTNLPVGDRWVEDNSYIRLKNLTLGYTLPKHHLLKGFRIYASANNVLTITRYQGWDPESNNFGSSNSLFYDNGTYPAAKSYVFGIQANF
ncbi:SusC/RagA family TonB-linked outer membrane protein [Parapedobacter pyrenivorans]|uniref:SusC/RagA family TonB-linked outer membrane protein n=1 Tax=Parapedobacter pyrenivorans TaxID=1305674 RepID=A0A917HPU5_9SPHI|nr:TonB-dependent receptor [Parapedobacter pyrenivorans]GGG86878.1 SusC/RagA family TonB-linked outer membrane protein [Parapedobacter pyrenivorans]